MPQGRTRGGNAPDARTPAAGPPQAPRRHKPPRTSQIGPPAQAGRQAPTSPAAGPPRHGQAATRKRRDNDTTDGDAQAPPRKEGITATPPQAARPGTADDTRTLTTAQHPDSPARGRTRRRNGETPPQGGGRHAKRPRKGRRPATARTHAQGPGRPVTAAKTSTLQGTPRKRRSFPTPGLPDAAKGRKRPRKRKGRKNHDSAGKDGPLSEQERLAQDESGALGAARDRFFEQLADKLPRY